MSICAQQSSFKLVFEFQFAKCIKKYIVYLSTYIYIVTDLLINVHRSIYIYSSIYLYSSIRKKIFYIAMCFDLEFRKYGHHMGSTHQC